MPSITILTGDWRDTLHELASGARESLTLCAPYVSARGASVIQSARRAARRPDLDLLVLTDLSAASVAAGSTEPEAVGLLASLSPRSNVVHLPRLHAKVYSADAKRAIVTSGNLTHGGLHGNFECGVLLNDPIVAGDVEREIGAYALLGAPLDRATIALVCELGADAREAHASAKDTADAFATTRLNAVLRAASDALLRARLHQGPIHTTFAHTIEFLLRQRGPLSTREMHPLIQAIHPDLCDDTVDRIIDGQRFGKKWKHAARTAQQQLKKRGAITLLDGKWSLVS